MSETAAALRLDLDHTGCIVDMLDAGAVRWERLGFTLTPESRQRGAVPGREGFHPWATANRCVILQNTYLELIGTVDAEAFNPWAQFGSGGAGLCILALRCDEADVAYTVLSKRTDAFRPPVPRERVLDVGGQPRTMRFRNIFSRDEVWPDARHLVIEHQTPEYLWQSRYQAHDNGARELVSVTFIADEPLELVPRMNALGAEITRDPGGGFTAKLPGHGVLHAQTPTAHAHGDGSATRAGMHAMAVSFGDLDRTIDFLKRRGVPVHDSAAGPWLAPHDTNGFVMQLVQDGA